MIKGILRVTACVLVSAGISLGGATIHDRGDWSADWPREFESLRERSTTYRVMAGNKEDVYEIPFDDRDEFERLWPFFLELADPGGKLTLYSVRPHSRRSVFRTSRPAVIISVPPDGVAIKPAGSDEYIHPQREDLYDQDGHLPEYVVWDGEQWVGVKSLRNLRPFAYRARVDLALVVDGGVIDLNRIPLPDDTTIIDRRKLGTTQPAEDEPSEPQHLPRLILPYFSDLRPDGLE